VELDNPVAAIEAFLQAGDGQRVVATVLLPSGEDYQVTECCSLPLQVKVDSRIRVKIADLGMGNFIERPWLTLIQPEGLRAPEVILGCQWGAAADIWSLGCIVSHTEDWTYIYIQIFEMLTNLVLFQPRPDDTGISATEIQLATMVELLGDIPRDMIKEGSQASKYFDRRGRSY
jgi:serine/threonine protein kinase